MTSLKCWNSDVESKAGSFINLPKRTRACRAPVSSFPSWARASLGFRFAGQFSVCQPASDDLLHDTHEALRVRHFPIVVTICLFIDIAEQVEWLDADVRAVQSALQETPEILHRVCVNVIINVFDSVINDRVLKVAFQAVVGLQFISKDRAASLYVLVKRWFWAAELQADVKARAPIARSKTSFE
jgi:hypothetical protein